jgi:hypothetical protein
MSHVERTSKYTKLAKLADKSADSVAQACARLLAETSVRRSAPGFGAPPVEPPDRLKHDTAARSSSIGTGGHHQSVGQIQFSIAVLEAVRLALPCHFLRLENLRSRQTPCNAFSIFDG